MTILHPDAKGRPLKFFMTAGQVSDYMGAAALLRDLTLRGKRSAFERPGGAILEVVAALQAGQFDELRQRFNDWQTVRGIRGLPDGFEPTDLLFDLLRDIYRDADGNANVRSGVFVAAARLDELEDAGAVVAR